jgi:hypothetical protein
MAFTDQAALAKNEEFILRVRVALCKACIAVASEAYGGQGQPSAAQHNLRTAYATQTLRDPDPAAIRYAWGVVTNAVVTAASPDDALEFTVNSMFDAYAGVVPAAVA